MITIGHMARTYRMLPSEVLARATTYDLMITDVYTTWEQHQQDPNSVDNYNPDDLKTMMQRSRNEGRN